MEPCQIRGTTQPLVSRTGAGRQGNIFSFRSREKNVLDFSSYRSGFINSYYSVGISPINIDGYSRLSYVCGRMSKILVPIRLLIFAPVGLLLILGTALSIMVAPGYLLNPPKFHGVGVRLLRPC